MELKQYIVIRSDLGLSPGKIAVQAVHAAILSYENVTEEDKEGWTKEGQKTIVLKVGGKEDLLTLAEKASDLMIPFAIVKDAGLTEVPPGTITALGLGPADSSKIDEIAGDLELL